MTGERAGLAGLIADADVLIDYADSDKGILSLISRCVAALHVASPVLQEVQQLTEKEARQLGIIVVEPTLSQVLEAGVDARATSFQDRLCLILAREAGWSVFTNDTALRSACRDGGIRCMWGLAAMVVLAEQNHLSAKRAISIAEKIAKSNRFITEAVLAKFRKSIDLGF